MSRRAACVLLLVSSVARAQEPAFEAVGQAPVVAGDRVRARERALDEALRQAVEQAVATVLDPDALVARASDLKLRIYPKAKTYVATYRVLDEGEQNGLFQMHLSASVATGRLQRDLATGGPTVGLPRLTQKLRAVVCAAASGEGSATLAPLAAKAVREALAARNVEALAAPETCTAEAAAQSAKSQLAQGAVVALVESAAAGGVRGTDRVAAHVKARVQLVEPEGRASAEGEAERDAYDLTLDRAAAGATNEALAEALRLLQPHLASRWAPVAVAGGVAVRLSGVSRFADYLAVVRALSGLPGVAGVEPRRFVRGEAELVVRTASPAGQLAAGLARVPPAGVKLTVKAEGDGLTVEVIGGGEG